MCPARRAIGQRARRRRSAQCAKTQRPDMKMSCTKIQPDARDELNEPDQAGLKWAALQLYISQLTATAWICSAIDAAIRT
jgi:hypothetical protein